MERRVDGLIMMSAPGDVTYLVPDIRHGLAIVALDRPLEGLDVDTVTVDNEAGARELVSRLFAMGHRRVAALAGDVRLWPLARRLDGYRAAFADAGMAIDETLVSTCRLGSQAQAALRDMLAFADPPTAVFAAHHMVGRAAMRATHDSGASLDIAVFDSVDDNDLLVTPPVAIAAQGPDRIGRLAARLLVDRLEGLRGPPRHAVLAPLILGPDERYVPSAGPVEHTVRSSSRAPEPAPSALPDTSFPTRTTKDPTPDTPAPSRSSHSEQTIA
jgi:LacI family transcriptional regulator